MTRQQPERSLASRMGWRVVTLVGVLVVFLAITNALIVRQVLIAGLDDMIEDQTVGEWHTQGYDAAVPMEIEQGHVSVVWRDDGEVLGQIHTGAQDEPLPAEVIDHLRGLPDDPAARLTVVPGLGIYRVLVTTDAPPVLDPADTDSTITRTVVGRPMTPVRNQIFTIIGYELVFGAVALIVGGLLARNLLRSSLAPLARLTDSVERIATLPLDRGDVVLPHQPEGAPSTTSEVWRLSTAFGAMVSHVGDAFDRREASETKVRRFMADASHELRNPLASIQGYAELLRRDRESLPPGARLAVDRVHAEAQRMGQLVEDMLRLARLDSERSLVVSPVRTGALLAEITHDVAVKAPEHTFRLDLPSEEVVAAADLQHLRQAIGNLLTNAQRHTPDGTRVAVSLCKEQSQAHIRVADDGPGMPPGFAEEAFDRFTRAQQTRRRGDSPSTGLGLAITQAAVSAMGGRITLESGPDGTIFDVWLPLFRDSEAGEIPALSTQPLPEELDKPGDANR